MTNSPSLTIVSGNRRFGTWAILFLLLAALVAQASWSAKDNALAMDELSHLTTGFIYLKTGKFKNLSNPPLLSQLFAWPLFALKVDFPKQEWLAIKDEPLTRINISNFAMALIFRNNIPPETILSACRSMATILSCLMALSIFVASRRFWDEQTGLACVFLYVTSPPMIAHSGLMMVDLGTSLIFFLSLLSFRNLVLRPTRVKALLTGIAFGATMAAKVSGVFLFPFALAILVVHRHRTKSWALSFENFTIIATASLAILALVFRFSELPAYIHNLRYIFGTAAKRGYGGYIFGQVSSNGWFYFPAVDFFLKNPLPAAILMLSGLWFIKKREDWHFFLIPMALYFALACTSKIQGGIRHLFPLYPFLIMGAGAALLSLLRNKKTRALACVLMGALIAEQSWAFPNYMAHLTALAGGPDHGWKLIHDMDFGQDVKRFCDYRKKHPGAEFVASLTQSASSFYYGATVQPYVFITFQEVPIHINSLHPHQELLAVSLSPLLTQKDKFHFLEKKQPVEKIGKTIFIYDITTDAQAHQEMAENYAASGLKEMAQREQKRVQELLLSGNP